MEVTTNEWVKFDVAHHPLHNREVLVRMSDGTLGILMWNGWYWIDPVYKTRQVYHQDGLHPTHFYIFEKFREK